MKNKKNSIIELGKHAELELARQCYSDYVEYTHNGLYKHARHTRYLCEKLQGIVTGKDHNRRVMIFLPPRHSKSMTVTETLPSAYLGHNPDGRVIISSYGDDLAQNFSRKNRLKVIEHGKSLFNTQISDDKSAVKEWDIAGHVGGLISAGIGGVITGRGADLLLIDDPVKNMQEANSETYRNRVYEEYQSTLRTRLHAGGNIIVILTRWHEDDLAGRLLRGEEEWEVINLPAVCESEDDPLGREIGELLWPEKGYDAEWAERTKREVGSKVWASLYQQRPVPADGNIFLREWWQFYTRDPQRARNLKIRLLPERFDRMIQSWDFAFKEKTDSDFVVGQIWGKLSADTFLLDQWRDRADFVRSIQAIRKMTMQWPGTRHKYVEDKANGPAIISALKKDIPGIVPVEPVGSKPARARSVTPEIESGNVYLPHPDEAPWVNDFILEHSAFPNGVNDDQVDATSQALNKLYGGGMRVLKPKGVK